MPTAEDNARGNSTSRGGKARGSARNESRLQAFGQSTKKGSADWGGCDARWVAAVVVRITMLGGAITFGLSRDQGAYMVKLMLDGDVQTLWFNGDADLDAELERVFAVLDTMS